MKKMLALCLVVALSVCGLVGCNKATNSDGVVTLTMGLPSGGDVTAMELVENFQKAHPEIKLVIDEAPWTDFKSKLKLQITSGNAPTVFITDSGYTAVLGEDGMALDLSEWVNSELNSEEYSNSLFAAQNSEGKLWGVPHGINSLAVYYNKDLFDEAGIPYPTEDWTFEEMFDIARKLTKDTDGDGETDQYGFMSGTNITTGWLPMILSTGGAPLDETRTKSMFNDKKTIEGLRKYVEKTWEGIEPSTEWAAAHGGTAAFYTGKIGMYMGLQTNVPVIEKNKKADLRYDVQIMPYGWDGKRPCVYVPNLWVVNSKASESEQKAALEWLKYYMSDEAQKIMIESGLDGVQPKLTALEHMESIVTSPSNFQAFYKGLNEHGVSLFENPTWEKWVKEVSDVTLRMLNKLTNFDDGINELHTKVSKILTGEY